MYVHTHIPCVASLMSHNKTHNPDSPLPPPPPLLRPAAATITTTTASNGSNNNTSKDEDSLPPNFVLIARDIQNRAS